MKLVVDASVAVKWFVSETLSGEARLLLSHRLELHAPDLLLAEYANVIWKKVRRRELKASPEYTDALSNLSENVALHPIGDLIERAMQVALDLDHPIYDCLYLACAEATESTLITADEKLANKMAGSSLDTDVRYIGSNGFAGEIVAAATAPVIQEEMLAQLIEAHDLLAETWEGVRTARYGQTDRLIIETTEDARFHVNSPALPSPREAVPGIGRRGADRFACTRLVWQRAGRRLANALRTRLQDARRRRRRLHAEPRPSLVGWLRASDRNLPWQSDRRHFLTLS